MVELLDDSSSSDGGASENGGKDIIGMYKFAYLKRLGEANCKFLDEKGKKVFSSQEDLKDTPPEFFYSSARFETTTYQSIMDNKRYVCIFYWVRSCGTRCGFGFSLWCHLAPHRAPHHIAPCTGFLRLRHRAPDGVHRCPPVWCKSKHWCPG